MSFKIAPSPHGHNQRTTSEMMRWVCYALVPGVLLQSYFFGPGVWFQITLAVATAVLAEMACTVARERPAFSALRDNTAIVTAILLAISIPSLAPWWVIVIGTLFAIVVVKHVYGGMGQNLFNPAMAGYVLLLISFPVQMTNWLPASTISEHSLTLWQTLHTILFEYTPAGYSVEQLRAGIDGVTMATPLDTIKTELTRGYTLTEIYQGPEFSYFAGAGWQWINLGFLVGGLLLIQQRIISWHIPLGFLAGLCVPAFIAHIFAPDLMPGPIVHALSGATMLGAFFIATDPVSAATSNRGRVIFALLIGFIVFVIRSWGGYPDAVAFAVLLANMCVPLIDRYTRPVVYGHGD
ncbi:MULTISPECIES: electron transport complex subunit RsxD [Idiomarina]|uniref:electron transport complex subunit RsxD n=1 Tax=Idiomarina TaxID=135575 RepID=UPI001CD6AD5D|nr:electron transport complex subunit RsxD [Idiomarina abyssalis]MDA6065597.1 electron transport complex subunit RsxD [Idiomarina abyssalis]